MKMTTAMTAITTRRSPIKQVREKPEAPVLNPPPMLPAMAKPCPRRCVSGAAGCWATAPAAARAARSPPSFSTTGCAAAAGRCGCPPPTSCWKTRAATGPRSAAARPTSSRWASSARGPIFLKRPESCSPPMQPCARPPARESARASNRSSAGSPMAWTKTPAMPLAASSCSTRPTPWPTPPGPRDRAAIRPPRSRDAPDCVCRTPCRMPASSMSPPPAPPPCPAWPMRGASACGAARIQAARRPSSNAPISSPPWRPAGSRRWRWWPAI